MSLSTYHSTVNTGTKVELVHQRRFDLVARSQGIPLELKFFESTVLIEVICGELSRESFSLTVINTLNPELFDLVAG